MTQADIITALSSLNHKAVGSVARWEVELRRDSTGDPAVFVKAVFRDDRIRVVWPEIREFERAGHTQPRGSPVP